MTDITEGIILAIKHNYNNLDDSKECVKKFLSDYCLCPLDEYTDNTLLSILETALCDYMTTCDKRYSVLADYFHYRHYPFKDNDGIDIEIYAILFAFQSVQVKKNVENKLIYVNGFQDFEFNDIILHLT